MIVWISYCDDALPEGSRFLGAACFVLPISKVADCDLLEELTTRLGIQRQPTIEALMVVGASPRLEERLQARASDFLGRLLCRTTARELDGIMTIELAGEPVTAQRRVRHRYDKK